MTEDRKWRKRGPKQSAIRARNKESGGRQLSVLLGKDAADALDGLRAAGYSVREAVEAALTVFARLP